jgi:hypothetical protein
VFAPLLYPRLDCWPFTIRSYRSDLNWKISSLKSPLARPDRDLLHLTAVVKGVERRSGRRGQNEIWKGQRRSLNRRRQIHTWDLVKFFDQSFCIFEISGVEALNKPIIKSRLASRALRGGYWETRTYGRVSVRLAVTARLPAAQCFSETAYRETPSGLTISFDRVDAVVISCRRGQVATED